MARRPSDGASEARLEHVLAAGHAYHEADDVGVSFKDLLRKNSSSSRDSERSSKDAPEESEHSIALRRRAYERAKTEVLQAQQDLSPESMSSREFLQWLQTAPKHVLVRWYNKLQQKRKKLEERAELVTTRARAIRTRVDELMKQEQAGLRLSRSN